jgi:sec-independent protein translocase protein TatB
MFDIGWTELLVVAVVAILVVGPKDLPRMLRQFGKTVGQMRKMAGEFQSQFNDALKEAELDEVRRSIEDVRSTASGATNPLRNIGSDLRRSVEQSSGTKKPAPASAPPRPAVAPVVTEPVRPEPADPSPRAD